MLPSGRIVARAAARRERRGRRSCAEVSTTTRRLSARIAAGSSGDGLSKRRIANIVTLAMTPRIAEHHEQLDESRASTPSNIAASCRAHAVDRLKQRRGDERDHAREEQQDGRLEHSNRRHDLIDALSARSAPRAPASTAGGPIPRRREPDESSSALAALVASSAGDSVCPAEIVARARRSRASSSASTSRERRDRSPVAIGTPLSSSAESECAMRAVAAPTRIEPSTGIESSTPMPLHASAVPSAPTIATRRMPRRRPGARATNAARPISAMREARFASTRGVSARGRRGSRAKRGSTTVMRTMIASDTGDRDDERIRERAAHGRAHLGGRLGQIRGATNRRSDAGPASPACAMPMTSAGISSGAVGERARPDSCPSRTDCDVRQRFAPRARREILERVQRAAGESPDSSRSPSTRRPSARSRGARAARVARDEAPAVRSTTTNMPRDATTLRACARSSASSVPRSSDPSRAIGVEGEELLHVPDEGDYWRTGPFHDVMSASSPSPPGFPSLPSV